MNQPTKEETTRVLDAIFGTEKSLAPKPKPSNFKPISHEAVVELRELEKKQVLYGEAANSTAHSIETLTELLIKPEAPVKERPKFVRKPHLTDRPLKQHEGLAALKNELEKTTPRRPQSRTNKEKK